MNTRHFLLSLLVALLPACQSAYYSAMERFGVEKRDILVSRVQDAQSAQEDGQAQFVNALAQFRSVIDFEGGDLETVYNRLDSEFQRSEAAAARIRSRINAVETVAEDLFDEWEDELDLYTNQNLRRESEQQLRDTRQRYARLIGAMNRAEQSLDPVLDNLRDNVLYLRHNLNSRAVASIRGELDVINADVDELVEAMQQAIAESQRFISGM